MVELGQISDTLSTYYTSFANAVKTNVPVYAHKFQNLLADGYDYAAPQIKILAEKTQEAARPAIQYLKTPTGTGVALVVAGIGVNQVSKYYVKNENLKLVGTVGGAIATAIGSLMLIKLHFNYC